MKRWHAVTIAHGPPYAIQVDTWAAHVRRAGGRPYVHCNYAPVADRMLFLEKRPLILSNLLAELAEVGRTAVLATDVDARFRATPSFFTALRDSNVEVAPLWRPARRRYEPGIIFLRACDGARDFLERWKYYLTNGQADDVAITTAANEHRGNTGQIHDSFVAIPQWGHLPPSPEIVILERGWDHVEVTPETVGRWRTAGGQIIGE